MDINTAIPCGLIINELFSNAIKHAFPDKRKGNIFISFRSEDEKNILIVQDNGIGFPSDIDIENPRSLGLQLLNALVQQLHGQIEMHVNEFTQFQVSFDKVFLNTYSGIENN